MVACFLTIWSFTTPSSSPFKKGEKETARFPSLWKEGLGEVGGWSCNVGNLSDNSLDILSDVSIGESQKFDTIILYFLLAFFVFLNGTVALEMRVAVNFYDKF